MTRLQDVVSSPVGWVALGLALLLPVTWPLLALLIPIGALALLSANSGDAKKAPSNGATTAEAHKPVEGEAPPPQVSCLKLCRLFCLIILLGALLPPLPSQVQVPARVAPSSALWPSHPRASVENGWQYMGGRRSHSYWGRHLLACLTLEAGVLKRLA
jgi:hypothetical protein